MIDGVNVVGPFNSPGVSKTTSRERLFICQPQPGPSGPAGEERTCARSIIENLARRAFRRPVTKDEVDSLMPYFEAGQERIRQDLMRASNKQWLPCWSIPTSSIARFERRRAGANRRRRRVPVERSGTRFAPVVLPVESGAR